MDKKKRVFSGIQPTGCITLGNYLGAVKNWVALQDEYECLYNIVDLHCITVRQEPKVLRERSLEFIVELLACGINPNEHLLYFQSHVAGHTQLAWVLNCFTYMGELQRMTQFKDKSLRHSDNINAGLFTYPVLMAADILLYKTDLVPVGSDQKQHLELARDIAIRFNGIYGDTFTVPEPYIPPVGARIMSLTEPTNKMSKSDPNPKSYISIMDSPETIIKKIKGAVTDSIGDISYSEGRDGINNLLSIYSAVTGEKIESIVSRFEGKGYGEFKTCVGEAVAESLRPVQAKADDLRKNMDYVRTVYTSSAQKANMISMRTIEKVYKKLGFAPQGIAD